MSLDNDGESGGNCRRQRKPPESFNPIAQEEQYRMQIAVERSLKNAKGPHDQEGPGGRNSKPRLKKGNARPGAIVNGHAQTSTAKEKQRVRRRAQRLLPDVDRDLEMALKASLRDVRAHAGKSPSKPVTPRGSPAKANAAKAEAGMRRSSSGGRMNSARMRFANPDDGNSEEEAAAGSTSYTRSKPYSQAEALKLGVQDMDEAVTFHPTPEEFADPMKYIAEVVTPGAEQCGIAKIVPPAGWSPQFALNRSTSLPTRLQPLHLLMCRGAPERRSKLRTPAAGGQRAACEVVSASCSAGVDPPVLAAVSPGKSLADCAVATESPLRGVRCLKSETVIGTPTCEDARSVACGESPRERRDDASQKRRREDGDGPCEDERPRKRRHITPERLCTITKEEQQGLERALQLSLKTAKQRMGSAAEQDFGFGTGRHFNLREFKEAARNFKRSWFNMGRNEGQTQTVSAAEIEQEFWRVIETASDPTTVEYGSDIDSLKYGSGFSRSFDSPWNLTHFARRKGSLLAHLEDGITGVTSPWLYMGQLFGCFCWHVEDNYLYSINYLHCGAPKTWYGVSAKAAGAFENLMRECFPDLVGKTPDLLFHLVTMLPPHVIRESGIAVTRLQQNRGEFVITLPQAYHAGFSHGFNVAEAVNFATADWLPFGREAVDAYRHTQGKTSVFSYEQLLCQLSERDLDAYGLRWLLPEILMMRDREQQSLAALRAQGNLPSKQFRIPQGEMEGEDMLRCHSCRHFLFLSAITCPCSSSAVCLDHASNLACGCQTERRVLVFRYTPAELDALVTRVADRVTLSPPSAADADTASRSEAAKMPSA